MVLLFTPYERWVEKYKGLMLGIVKNLNDQKEKVKEKVEEEKVQQKDEEFKEDEQQKEEKKGFKKEYFVMICIADQVMK